MEPQYIAWLVYTRFDNSTIAAAAVVEKGDKSALLADKIQISSDDVDELVMASISWIKGKLAGKGTLEIREQSEVMAMTSSEVILSRSVSDFDRYVKAYWAFSNFGKNEYTARRRRRKSDADTSEESIAPEASHGEAA